MKIGYVYSVLSAIFFGSAGLIVKYAYAEGSESVSLLTLQYILAVTLMFVLIFITNRSALKISRTELFHTAVLGIVGNTFMTIFYYLAFSYLAVPMVAILLYTYPVIVFVYSFIFEKESISLNRFIAMLMAFLGCILALGLVTVKILPIPQMSLQFGAVSATGLICGLLAAVFFAFMNIYSEKKLSNMNSFTINFYSTTFSLISLMAYQFPYFIFRGEFSLELLKYTAILAVVCEIIPLTLLYAAIKQIGSLKVSIIGNLEIPTAMILSYLFLNEVLTALQVIGAFMVVFAVYRIRK